MLECVSAEPGARTSNHSAISGCPYGYLAKYLFPVVTYFLLHLMPVGCCAFRFQLSFDLSRSPSATLTNAALITAVRLTNASFSSLSGMPASLALIAH